MSVKFVVFAANVAKYVAVLPEAPTEGARRLCAVVYAVVVVLRNFFLFSAFVARA